ncbi:ARC6 homolog [Klebsormidium nitens]|uniref:ARC6 homolog n=1 Tax=Klebsormidium nitens TaxID=105231 RepID=A0A1Y1HMH5_KLENI|nr:ARC6 homolog [Klebsormidium nitens]|eukprot:GAQ77806.1 ARC6 homolog [Klebsormidium nitens]
MAGSAPCACFPASFQAQWSHIATYGRTLRLDLPATALAITRPSPHLGLHNPGSRGGRWIVNASIAGTGEVCNGSANGVHSKGSEAVPVARHWQERAVSWVAQPAAPGALRDATDYCDVPLNYYQILGLRESATQDEVWHAHQCALKASLAEEGYSQLAISARKEILDAAYSVLGKDTQRREYTAHVRRSRNGVLSVPWEWVPGLLILAQQAGDATLVLSCGEQALQRTTLNPLKGDVVLAMALAQCSLARDDFEADSVCSACAHLRTALELLQQGGDLPLRPDLQAQIERTLTECGPAAILEHLAQPATPGNLTARSAAVRQSLELVQAALTHAPRGDQLGTRVGWFLAAAQESMGADEGVNGLPWEAISKAYRGGEVDTPVMLRGAMAHCALGFRNREPKMVEQCGELLGLVVDREGERASVHAEMAVVALLLGLVDTALDWLSDVTPPPPGKVPVAGSVEEALRALTEETENGNKDGVMHNLCLFTERFLHTRILASFWDTRRSSPPLSTYLEDKRVEHYWQSAAGGSPRTALLAYARATAEAIHTVVEKTKWAVQHARSKLRETASVPTPPESEPTVAEQTAAALLRDRRHVQSLATTREEKASVPDPLENEVNVVERTAAALLSDRRNGGAVRPKLPPLASPVVPPPQSEGGIAPPLPTAALPAIEIYPPERRRPRSRSPSPERPALPPVEKRLEAQRQGAQRRSRVGKKSSLRGGDMTGLAGGLLLAGVTLLVGLVGREKLFRRTPETPHVTSARPSAKAPPLVVKPPRVPLADTPPPSTSGGVIPEGVRLPDTVPPATEWKRSEPPAAIALPAMSSREAEALVRKWHAAKADALGPQHAKGRLSDVALPPLKMHWAKIAEDARRGGRYWNYKLLDVAVDSAKVWRSQRGSEEEASLEVTIEEAAELVDTRDVSDNAVYYSTYRARYSLRRVDGDWKFCEGGKTR